MNSSKNLFRALALALAFVIVQGSAFAGAGPKTIQKARKAVESAAPHDWKTFAEAASMCFEKSVNWDEALTWVKKSVDIKETSYNLEVLGDYYLKNNMPEQAIKYFIKSMDVARAQDIKADLSTQQAKISKAYELKSKV
ncbi:MAG: tetratricopeptide repeat protein [bacterium]|nr:tetratricopeptide repeat protein [bacterium]